MIHRVLFLGAIAGLFLLAGCNADPSIPPPPLPRFQLFELDSVDYGSKVPIRVAYQNELVPFAFGPTPAKARYRGGASSVYPKHSFTLRLAEAQSLCGMPKDKDWILNASYIDRSFSRHTVSYDLFRAFSDRNIAPQHAPVEVYLGDAYYGLFLLMERLDGTRLQLDKKNSGACYFKDPPVFRNQRFMDTYPHLDTNNLYHQKFPKVRKRNFNAELDSLRQFIFYASDSAFADADQGIFHRFDQSSVIDWHLLLLVTNNGDGIAKNFYLYRQRAGDPFRIAPWDYDSTFGRDGDSEPHWEGVLEPEQHVFFQRLMELNPNGYREALKQRFKDLQSQGILTVAGINERLLNQWERLYPYFDQNAQKWPIDERFYIDACKADCEIPRMQEWVTNHLPLVAQKLQSL
ncbi:MAG: CotH kinase family protein [Salibacteraceae bacterium]